MTDSLWLVRMRLGTVLVLAGIASNLSAQTITTFDAAGSADTEPAAINSRGQITGRYVDASSQSHGFLRECGGALIPFDVPSSTNTQPAAMNARGQITGYYADSSSALHGFLRERDGTFTVIDVPDSFDDGIQWHTYETAGTAINPAGQVTGYYSQTSVPAFLLRVQGFLRSSDGTLTTFGLGGRTYMTPTAINPIGQIVGSVHDDVGPTLAFLRDADGTLTIFTDHGDEMRFQDINPAGQIVGFGRVSGGFVRQPDGTITTINVPGSDLTHPDVINAPGRVAGSYSAFDGIPHGFLREGDGTFALFDVPGSSSTQPTGMNLSSQITGYYQDATGVHGFLRSGRRC